MANINRIMSNTVLSHAEDRHRAVLKVLSGIVICIFLAALDQTVVIPAIPAIAQNLHDHRNLSWILTAYLLASTVSAPIYGRLSDVHGRRRLLEISLVIFIVASVVCGFATSIWQLVIFRALQGLGGGGLMSLAQAAIADAVSPRERGRYQGYLAGVWAVASIAGPLVGGYLADHASWKWLFWVNLPLGLIALKLCRRGLPAKNVVSVGKARFDAFGSLLMVISVSALLLILTLGGNTVDWISSKMLGLISLAGIGLWALSLQQRRRGDGLFPPRLFDDASLVSSTIISTLSAAGVFASLFVLPIFYQTIFHADATDSGLLMIPFLAANVLGNYVTGRLAKAIGRMKPVLIGGSVLTTVGCCALAIAFGHFGITVSVVLTVLAGAGLGSTTVGTLMVVQNAAKPGDMGAATGTLLLLRSIGSMLGGAGVGAYLEYRLHANPAGQALQNHVQLEGAATAMALPPSTFCVAFAGIAVLMLVAFFLSMRAPDSMLRGKLDNAAAADFGH